MLEEDDLPAPEEELPAARRPGWGERSASRKQ